MSVILAEDVQELVVLSREKCGRIHTLLWLQHLLNVSQRNTEQLVIWLGSKERKCGSIDGDWHGRKRLGILRLSSRHLGFKIQRDWIAIV